MTDSPSFHWISTHPNLTQQLGVWLGQQLHRGDLICLSGELGAGKTTFTAALGHGWGSISRLTSPTYTLIHVHSRQGDKVQLVHVDVYRLENDADFTSIALEDYLTEANVVIIEWAERVKSRLPDEYLWLEISHDDANPDYRHFTFRAYGNRYETLMPSIQIFSATLSGAASP